MKFITLPFLFNSSLFLGWSFYFIIMLLFKYFPYYYKGEKLCKIDGYCGDCDNYSICNSENNFLNCKSVITVTGTILEIYIYK